MYQMVCWMAVSVLEIHIVWNVRITKNAASRKEKLMLLRQLKVRLRTEYTSLCTYLTTAPITAEDLLSMAYEVVWKREIVNLFEVMPESNCRYSDDDINWILSHDNSLDFLYEIWRHTDYLLTAEFADLLHDELVVRKEGANG